MYYVKTMIINIMHCEMIIFEYVLEIIIIFRFSLFIPKYSAAFENNNFNDEKQMN